MTSTISSSTSMSSSMATLGVTAPSTSTSEIIKSSHQELSHEEHHHPSLVLQAGTYYSEILRHQVYHPAPALVRNVPTYTLQWLVQMNEHEQSEHRIRNATIGLIAEISAQEGLALLIGGTPAGVAMLTATVVDRMKESLPSMEEIGTGLISSDPIEKRVAQAYLKAQAAGTILALPVTAVKLISKLAQSGFDRLSRSSSRSSSSSSSSWSSSSSTSSWPSISIAETTTSLEIGRPDSLGTESSSISDIDFDETIYLGKERKDSKEWEAICIKILSDIGSSSMSSSASTETSSIVSTASESSDQSSGAESVEEQQGNNVKWTGVQVHIPLDQIKNTRISTGVQFGSSGQYQTGISTTLSHPAKDLQVSVSAQVSDSVAIGASTSLRHPVEDLHVGASSAGFGVSTSLRHPAKDVVIAVPITYLVGVQIPLKKISQARITIGVPMIPGASVSIPVRKVEKAVEKVIKEGVIKPIDKVVTRPLVKIAREARRPVQQIGREIRRFGRKLGF